jgi:EmrB/QacA subfamily drug resistance transporter
MKSATPSKYHLFVVGAIGTFMATLDGSILNVSLPTIARELDCEVDLVAWVVLAYSLTLISLLLPFGAWTQRRGYGFAYRFGYTFFLIGSVLCALSPDIYSLIAARVVQATGTAMFAAVGPGMVTTVFPREERGKGIGLMVMMVSAGFVTGPPLGGFILSVSSWHTIFLMNLPIGLVGLIMTMRYFSRFVEQLRPEKVSILAAACSSAGLVSGVFALSLIDEYAWSDIRIWGLGLVSVGLLATFLRLEASSSQKLIGLAIFRQRLFSLSLAAQLTHFAGLSGVLVLMPFYLERVQGLKPSQVSMYLVILPIMMFLVAPLSGRLSDRIGFRVLTSGGMAIMGTGLWLLTYLSPTTEAWYIVLCLVVVGFGVGMFTTPNSSALMGSVGPEQRAVASGILATNRNIGMSIGVALGTALFAHFQHQNAALGDHGDVFVASLQPVIGVAIGFVLAGLVFSLARGERPASQA